MAASTMAVATSNKRWTMVVGSVGGESKGSVRQGILDAHHKPSNWPLIPNRVVPGVSSTRESEGVDVGGV